MLMQWNPEQYYKFRMQRFAPFADLLPLIRARERARVIDLGCGSGEITSMLADAIPGSDILGIDASKNMLELAKRQASPGLKFRLGRIEDFAEPCDLIFSNAALHWSDDHPTLIPWLFSHLSPGGQIAVQVPSNHDHDSQRIIREIALETPFFEALQGWSRKSPVLSVTHYVELLYAAGAQNIVAFEKVYPHELDNADDILEWVRGTALLPYLQRLPEDLPELFIERYRERLHERWPGSPVLYTYQRILFAARKPE